MSIQLLPLTNGKGEVCMEHRKINLNLFLKDLCNLTFEQEEQHLLAANTFCVYITQPTLLFTLKLSPIIIILLSQKQMSLCVMMMSLISPLMT